MELEAHAEELASDLGADKEEVKADLENLLSYSVPVDEAKQSLRRKYGDGSQETAVSTKQIEEITTSDSNITTTARVLSVGKRSIQYNGDNHVIFEGELADETGKISYTSWEDFGLEAGETIQIGNAGVREWDEKPELNLGESTQIDRVEQSIAVPYDIGGERNLAEVEPGDRGVTVEVTVLDCESKTINGRDGETEILSGELGDETGRLPFTDWEPRSTIEAGASIRIENAFIREFRGVPSVNVSEFSTASSLGRTVEVSTSATRYSIRDAIDSGGMYDIELVGNIVDIRDGSGLIERCPECGRVTQNGQCRSHGEVDGEDDLRTKAILDDGTGTVTVILDKELTAQVYGGTLADAMEHARDAMDREVVAERIASTVVGREFCVRGSLTIDDYGANLEASECAETDEQPAKRAEQFLSEVNG